MYKTLEPDIKYVSNIISQYLNLHIWLLYDNKLSYKGKRWSISLGSVTLAVCKLSRKALHTVR